MSCYIYKLGCLSDKYYFSITFKFIDDLILRIIKLSMMKSYCRKQTEETLIWENERKVIRFAIKMHLFNLTNIKLYFDREYFLRLQYRFSNYTTSVDLKFHLDIDWYIFPCNESGLIRPSRQPLHIFCLCWN